MTLRIALIDDHLLFRQGLRALLTLCPDLTVVAEGADAQEVIPLLDKEAADVVVVDLELRGSSGIAATQEIAQRYPSSHVLVLTMHTSEEYAARAFSAGASGYALKDQDVALVLDAIRAVGAGQRYLAPSMPARVLGGSTTKSLLDQLSRREREVFDLVVHGRSNRAIAAQLSISIKTVETHRTNINRKLEAHSTADLVRFAARQGVLTDAYGPMPPPMESPRPI